MNDKLETELEILREKLGDTDLKAINVLIGFDGFVDEILHVVKKRYDMARYDRYEYLHDYGTIIAQAGGLSLNVELMPVRKKIGGNGVLMADALADQGMNVTYIGACGKPQIHQEFEEFSRKVKLYSISNPAITEAIEFMDGKIISSRLKELENVNWKNMMREIGLPAIQKMMTDADIIAFGNWSLVFHMTDIWRNILVEIAPNMKERKPLFIDLANPEKRTDEDILEAFSCIGKFNRDFNVVLGLNKKELSIAAQTMGIHDTEETQKHADLLRRKLGIEIVIVHNALFSLAVSEKEQAYVETPHCKNSRQMTGAGDNFNAGFLLGLACEFSLKEALYLAVASSGFYIRECASAKIVDIMNFLQLWGNKELL